MMHSTKREDRRQGRSSARGYGPGVPVQQVILSEGTSMMSHAPMHRSFSAPVFALKPPPHVTAPPVDPSVNAEHVPRTTAAKVGGGGRVSQDGLCGARHEGARVEHRCITIMYGYLSFVCGVAI